MNKKLVSGIIVASMLAGVMSVGASADEAKSVEGMTVAFIPKVTGNAFFESANNGAQKYAEKWGITVDYVGNAKS